VQSKRLGKLPVPKLERQFLYGMNQAIASESSGKQALFEVFFRCKKQRSSTFEHPGNIGNPSPAPEVVEIHSAPAAR
jgi:hypothetical protein